MQSQNETWMIDFLTFLQSVSGVIVVAATVINVAFRIFFSLVHWP